MGNFKRPKVFGRRSNLKLPTKIPPPLPKKVSHYRSGYKFGRVFLGKGVFLKATFGPKNLGANRGLT